MAAKRVFMVLILISKLYNASAQAPANVGIGTTNPHSSALLELNSNNKGLLITRMTDTEMRNISSPAVGLIVVNMDDTTLYMNRDTGWTKIISVPGGTHWLLTGNDLINSNSGNIGIGSNPVHARLEINGSIGSTVAMFGADKSGTTVNADNPGIGFNYFYNSGAKTIKAGYAGLLEMNPSDGSIYIGNFNGNQSASDFGSISGYQSVLNIKQDGKVGIGNPPFYDGRLNIRGDNGINLYYSSAGGPYGTLSSDNPGNLIINSANSNTIAALARDIFLNPYIDFTTPQYRGNLGIRTNNASHAIVEVADVVGATVAMFGNNKFGTTVNADNPGIGLNYFYNGGSKAIRPGYAGLIEMNRFNGDIYIGNFNGNQSSSNYGAISGYQNTILIKQNGNVGIGTDNPTYKLSVNGNIRSKEVVVESGWADYVFSNDYSILPLTEVEKFIQVYKHLPGIPAAAEIQNNGLNVGDMQTKMMQKIEELTLYVIELKKEIEALKTHQ